MNRQSLNRSVDSVHAPKAHKYGAKKRIVDGITFDSIAESEYYLLLKSRQQAGIIQSLILQPRYEILSRCILPDRRTVINPVDYVSDFQVTYPGGRIEVIDVKGAITEGYKLKAKMFQTRHPNLPLIALTKYGGEWMLVDEANKLRREKKRRAKG